MSNKSSKFIDKWLLGVMGIVIVTISILICTLDKKFTVVHFAEVKQDGYGVVAPETFKVEMAPYLAFKYAYQHKTTGFVIACAVLIISCIWVPLAEGEVINFGKANDGIYDNAGKIWIAFVLISVILFFSNHGSIMGNNYLNLDRTTYVNIRGNDQRTPFASKEIESMFLNRHDIIK